MIPILGAIVSTIGGVFKKKMELKEAIMDNKIRMAMSENEMNHEWEMKSLNNAGYKDDVLFYAVILFFVFSGIFPERAAVVFANWELIPEWFLQITMWLVASVVGVKKVGEYVPSLISAIKDAVKK